MVNLPHSKPDMATLKAQLNRLYRRQLVLDELIRLLERYAASEARRPAEKQKAPAQVITLRHTA
jgi:hypothetical protein